jgi:hypothetical protein
MEIPIDGGISSLDASSDPSNCLRSRGVASGWPGRLFSPHKAALETVQAYLAILCRDKNHERRCHGLQVIC